MRILGIDFGTRRVGLAASDPSGRLASPYKTLPFADEAQVLDAVTEAIELLEAARVVIGLPFKADGSMSSGTLRALSFGHALASRVTIPVTWVDESFTTSEARHRLREGGKRRTPKEERLIIDQIAATVLVEEYLTVLHEPLRPLPPLPPPTDPESGTK